MVGKEEEESRLKNHFAMIGFWIHELCLQSQSLLQLDQGGLLKSNELNVLFFAAKGVQAAEVGRPLGRSQPAEEVQRESPEQLLR